jgi:hypothetical protein
MVWRKSLPTIRCALDCVLLQTWRANESLPIGRYELQLHKTFALAPHTDLVKKLVAEQPDSTLAELKARLAKER